MDVLSSVDSKRHAQTVVRRSRLFRSGGAFGRGADGTQLPPDRSGARQRWFGRPSGFTVHKLPQVWWFMIICLYYIVYNMKRTTLNNPLQDCWGAGAIYSETTGLQVPALRAGSPKAPFSRAPE